MLEETRKRKTKKDQSEQKNGNNKDQRKINKIESKKQDERSTKTKTGSLRR